MYDCTCTLNIQPLCAINFIGNNNDDAIKLYKLYVSQTVKQKH
jgi:hypothetical protein